MQFSAIIPVICRVCQAGKRLSQLLWSFVKFSGWNAVFCSFSGFCKAWQAGKLFSAITPMICKVCQTGKQFSAVTPIICKVLSSG
jgi:hypothetical protein